MPSHKSMLALAISASVLTSQLSHAQDESKTAAKNEPVDEVVIIGSRKAFYTEITQNAQKLVEMPGALGDPLGAITALPGVITPAGGGEPAVRGSSPEDNRYFIDSIPAGYIFHQFNTSILDENVVQDFQLFSAGFGVQYSGATGAIFDVRLREPKNQDFQTTINASMLRAGLFMESRVTDNSAFYLSARVGLIQLFITEDDEPDDEGFRIIDPPEDSDYQLKYVWDVNSDNSISFLLAGATDYIAAELTNKVDFVQENPDFAGDAKLEEGFDSQGITWRRELKSGGESVWAIASYQDTEKLEFGNNYYIESVLDDTLLRGHITVPITRNHTLTVGGEYNDYSFDYTAHLILFVCTDFEVDCQESRGKVVDVDRVLKIADSTAYLTDLWDISDTLNIETGLQWNHNNYTDESFISPRVSVEWQAWPSVAITSSAGEYNRLPDVEYIIPLIGNPNLKSSTAEHFTLGLKGDIGVNWNWSTEIYHKNLANLPLALGDDQPDSKKLYSNDIKGSAQGFDLFLNRDLDDSWYGWVALSYSRSHRTNERTNETRDYFLDTPLVLNVVGNYQINELWDVGLRLTAKSGQAVTEVIGVRENPEFEDSYLPVYADEAYGDRAPYYARLDLRAKRDIHWFGNEGSFYIDVLNASNRDNVIDTKVDYEKVISTGGEFHTKDDVDLGIFPSIGVSFTF